MPIGLPIVRRVMTIAWVARDVIAADDSRASEGWFEHACVAWHRKFFEVLAIDARERIQHVRFARFVNYVVEKRAKSRACQFGGGIGDGLDELMHVVQFRHRPT